MLSMGTAVLFEKVLTGSDASGNGRIVIPKVCNVPWSDVRWTDGM